MLFASRRLIVTLVALAMVGAGATTAIVLAANHSETPGPSQHAVVELSPTPKADEALASGSQASPTSSREADSEAPPTAPYEADSEANPSPSTGAATSVTPTVEPCSVTGGPGCENVINAPPMNEGDTSAQPPVGTGPGVGEGESGAVTPSRHEVSIRFNETVQQSDIDEVAAVVATYDKDANFVVLQLFPPVAHAVIGSDIPGFCDDFKARLEGRPYVDSVSCE